MVVSTWTPEATELSRQLAISLGQIRDDDSPGVVEAGPQSPRKERNMTLVVTPEEGKAALEPDSYVLTCLGVKADRIENSKFDPNVYRYLFTVDDEADEDGGPIKLDAISSVHLTPNSKGYRWLTQAFGLPLAIGEAIDIDDECTGKKVLGVVIVKDGFNRVDDLLPVPTRRQKATTSAPAARTTAPEDLSWEDAEADANALESFYEAGDQYARRSEIKSTSQRMFDNRLPEALTTQEREELLAELKRGAS